MRRWATPTILRIKMKSAVLCFACIVFCIVEYQCSRSDAVELSQRLLDAIRYVESGGDVCTLGDSASGMMSLGAYQITRDYYNEAVEANATLTANGQAYADLWGEGSVPYSENVIRAYVGRYATPSRLGHVPTDEDFARIHRGGPNGWNSSSTQEYWSQVSAAMNLGRAVPNGVNTDKCNISCGIRQCCDRNEEGDYECFCLQAKVNSPEEYVKRPCENCSEIAGIDIVFVLDSSGSIGITNFVKIRNFVNMVISDLDIGPRRTQVGVIVFSTDVSVYFNLNTYSNRQALTSAVNRIPYLGSGTNTADALYTLINRGFIGARPVAQGVPRVVMVVTDGMSNDPILTKEAAEALRRVPSITTYAIGIGSAKITELRAIASTRNGQKLVRYISSFDVTELERLQDDLREQACTASIIVDVETTPIFRELDFRTKLYLEYFVPGDGFTIQVELDIGRVVVCGSNSLERPDCSYSLTYDWKLEISEYEELFIGLDGFPSNAPAATTRIPTATTIAPTGTPMSSNGTTTDITVYLTIEGLEDNNIFSLNTTYGDTKVSEPIPNDHEPTVTMPGGNMIDNCDQLDTYIIIGAAGGGAFAAVLIFLLAFCITCIVCLCKRRRRGKKDFSYKPYSVTV